MAPHQLDEGAVAVVVNASGGWLYCQHPSVSVCDRLIPRRLTSSVSIARPTADRGSLQACQGAVAGPGRPGVP